MLSYLLFGYFAMQQDDLLRNPRTFQPHFPRIRSKVGSDNAGKSLSSGSYGSCGILHRIQNPMDKVCIDLRSLPRCLEMIDARFRPTTINAKLSLIGQWLTELQ